MNISKIKQIILYLFYIPLFLLGICTVSPIVAQNIIQANDDTQTIILLNGQTFTIEGGTISGDGANLFHSFQQFGLTSGQIANFLSNPNIQNILGRVVGGDPSVINGLIQVTGGNSNLYLMNPAGIIFGNNASLNVPADFSATTATGIGFGNNLWFSVFGNNNYADLIGNPNTFIFDLTNPRAIINDGNLIVTEGQNLTLLGGSITNTGTIQATEGNIIIQAIEGTNTVEISQNGNILKLQVDLSNTNKQFTGLDLPQLLTGSDPRLTENAGNINLSGNLVSTEGTIKIVGKNINLDNATVGVSGVNGGEIYLLGDNNLNISNQSLLNASGNISGGFVETSAPVINFQGLVNTTGNTGISGTWLLDPLILTVANSGGDITPNTIITNLSSTNVVLQADQTININDGITWNTGNNLYIDAGTNSLNGTVNLNAPITFTSTGKLFGGNENQTHNYIGTINLNNTSAILQNGVDIAATGATINLTSGTFTDPTTITINKNLTINGQGQTQTFIDGQNTHRVIEISNNASVNFNKITIQNGYTSSNGAGISNNNATVTITNSNISSNSAKGFGGGLFNENNATVTITNSNISGNSAGWGAGIYNYEKNGTVNITNSNILNNTSYNSGGGISNFRGTVNIDNSTIAGNSALPKVGIILPNKGGGIYNYQGIVNITNSEISGNSARNGGGISSYIGSTLNITNSIISGNFATNSGGGIYSRNNTLNITNSNITGNSANGWGGGIYNRINSTLNITNSNITGNSANKSGGGIYNGNSILNINNSNISSNSASGYGGGLSNNSGTVTITNNSTISNNLANQWGGGIYNSYGTLNITNSTVSGNSANINYRGGGIFNENNSTLTITNSTISNNFARWGGGISNKSNSTLNLINSTVSGNTADGGGGGIYNSYYSTANITDSRISGNSVNIYSGGGIFNWIGSTVNITNSSISNNYAPSGGGIFNRIDSTANINNSKILNNYASLGGGGIDNNVNATVNLTNSIVSGNYAFYVGGGISNSRFGTVNIINSQISHNSTNTNNYGGGGIANNNSIVNLTNSTISNNVASIGGGINNQNGVVTITNSIFSQNTNTDITNDNSSIVKLIGNQNFNNFIGESGTFTTQGQVTINANSFTISTGKFIASNLLTINANNIILNNPNNDFSSISLTGNNVNLTDVNNIDLSTSNINGNLNITTNGAITDSGAVIVKGTTTLNSNSDIILDNNNDFNLIQISKVNNLTLSDINSINFLNSVITRGGNLNITANDNITSNFNFDSSNINGQSGQINLIANNGVITTGNINSSGVIGGNIFLNAKLAIATGTINSSGTVGNGGNVTLDPLGDIQVSYINAQGGSNGVGGNIDITAGRYFRATNSFTAQNGLNASLSSVGGLGGGSIIIRHGGNGIIPFQIGNPNINGTLGAITSGNYSLTPFQSFPYTHILGNLQILSIINFNQFNPSNIHDLQIAPINANPILLINPETGSIFIPLVQMSIASADVPIAVYVAEVDSALTEQFSAYFALDNIVLPSSEMIASNTDHTSTTTNDTVQNNITSNTDNTSTTTSDTVQNNSESSAESTTSETNNSDYSNSESISETESFTNSTSSSGETDNNTESMSLAEVQTELRKVEEATGINPAIIQAIFVPTTENAQPNDQLELILTPSKGQPIIYKINVNREDVQHLAQQFNAGVTNYRRPDAYKESAQILYQWLIEPIKPDLEKYGIEHLTLSVDQNLRSIPWATLWDGNKHLIEQYSLSLMPSLALTNLKYVDVRNFNVLAMGAETFVDQPPLPAVPMELDLVTNQIWLGQSYLNQDFSVAQLTNIRKQTPYGLIHLATHGQFAPGKPHDSYIQFGDQKLGLDQLSQLGLNDPQVELMVLSACRSALGDQNAELGFAGLAVLAGVKSALGSLWYISDAGTLGLISEFYEQLRQTPIKAEALRQTQIAMLTGKVRLENGTLITTNQTFPLTEELKQLGNVDLSHPYYWSSFIVIGNPW